MTEGHPDPGVRAAIAALSEQMQANGNQRDTPVRSVSATIGDRWSTLILLVLDTGEWRHANLRRTLAKISAEQAISQRVLTLKLRHLERDGFVLRRTGEAVPPRVEYWLSPMGSELVRMIRQLIDWTVAHKLRIETARAAFDRDA